ncbi:MAG: hypothetical protein JOY62_11220 [Acidobacteriaceae bacterium]|nr:hypothetical protein [Acidobacteriaceae bacterium]MBV9780529.1 hypothetical protein [Acidobacteriaceae bacterium]
MRHFRFVTGILFIACIATTLLSNTNYTYKAFTDPSGTKGTQGGRVSNVGEIVGRYLTASGSDGFLYKSGKFTTIAPPGATKAVAADINNSGEIVGLYSVASGPNIAFIYNGGKYTEIKSPSSTLNSITFLGINDSGVIVGGLRGSATGQGFIYTKGKFEYLIVPKATGTEADGINNKGEVVGTYLDSSGKRHGFTYTSGKFTFIDVPGATETTVAGICYNFPVIVGAYKNSKGQTFGYVENNGKFTTIEYPGAVLTDATGINDKGVIAGFFKSTTNSNYEGFTATP